MPKFNLDLVIREHNATKSHKPINVRKNWGFVYFTPEGLKVLESISTMIGIVREQQTHRTSIKNLSKCYQLFDIVKSDKSAKDFFKNAKEVCNQALTITQSGKIYEWEVKQAEWLNREENWNHLMGLNPEARGTLTKLKTFWEKQSKFAYASNDFLLMALDQLGEPLEELALAEDEFKNKRRKLPKYIADQYAIYLDSLKAQLNQLKQDLLNTMYSRLYVAGESYSATGHFHKDDVIVYTVEQLQRIGVIKKDMQMRGYWQTLRPHHFNRFHEAIQRDGHQKLRQGLSQLPWFVKTSGVVETKNVMISKRTYLIPTELELETEFLNNKTWSSRLFRNRKHSIKFIKEHQATFASLKLGYPDVTLLEVNDRFQRLDQYEQTVKAASKKVSKLKPSVWQLWSYFGYRQLISKWQELLNQKAAFCLDERIRLLEQLVNTELAPTDKDKRYELWLVTRQQLSHLIPNRQLEITERMQRRLSAVDTALKTHLEQEPEQFAKCLVQSLAHNQELKEDELKYIIDFVEIKELSPDKQSWLNEITAYRSKAIQTLLLQTREACTEQDTCIASPIIMNRMTLVMRLADKQDRQSMQLTLKQIIFLQTRWLLKEELEQARQCLLSLQTLIYQFGNEALKTWMNKLPSDISDSNWDRFLNTWQSNLKLLQLPSGGSVVPAEVTTAITPTQKSFFSGWRMSASLATAKLSESLPIVSSEPTARSLVFRNSN